MRPTLEKFSNAAIILMVGLLILQYGDMLRGRMAGQSAQADGASFAADDPVFRRLDEGGSPGRGGLVAVEDIVGDGCGLVYFFDPECKACNKYAPSWAGTEVVEAGDIRLTLSWISIRDEVDLVADFFSKYHLAGNTYTLDGRYAPSQIGIAYVPQSLVVSPQGEALSWGGHLPEILMERLEARPELFESCADRE